MFVTKILRQEIRVDQSGQVGNAVLTFQRNVTLSGNNNSIEVVLGQDSSNSLRCFEEPYQMVQLNLLRVLKVLWDLRAYSVIFVIGKLWLLFLCGQHIALKRFDSNWWSSFSSEYRVPMSASIHGSHS